MSRRLALTLAFLMLPLSVGAQSASSTSSSSAVSTAACLSDIFAEMAHQQRLHRIVLFGRSEEAAESEVRYDREGAAWIRTGGVWRSRAPGKDRTPKTDAEMRDLLETDPAWESPYRRGILSTRTHLTSELLPPVLQSMRALRCRLRSVCTGAMQSIGLPKGSTVLEGSTYGCIPYTEMGIGVLPNCRLASATDNLAIAQVQKSCEEAFQALYKREERVLELLVSYDAAQRTLLQFAGGFQSFLDRFDATLLTPFRQVTQLLGQLSRVPCFLSQCDR